MTLDVFISELRSQNLPVTKFLESIVQPELFRRCGVMNIKSVSWKQHERSGCFFKDKTIGNFMYSKKLPFQDYLMSDSINEIIIEDVVEEFSMGVEDFFLLDFFKDLEQRDAPILDTSGHCRIDQISKLVSDSINSPLTIFKNGGILSKKIIPGYDIIESMGLSFDKVIVLEGLRGNIPYNLSFEAETNDDTLIVRAEIEFCTDGIKFERGFYITDVGTA